MRLKLIKYGIGYVLVCMIATFLMSHNTHAISSYIPDTAIGRFNVAYHANFNGDYQCSTQDPMYFQSLWTNLNMDAMVIGQDYLVSFTFFNASNSNSFDGKVPIALRSQYESLFTIREVQLEAISPSQFQLYMVVHRENGGTGVGFNLDIFSNDYFIFYNHECISNYGWFTRVKWTGDDELINYTGLLNSISSQLNAIQNSQPTQQQITTLNNSVNNLNSTIENHYQKEDAAINNIDNQRPSDIGNTDSQETTSLINTITNFVNALRGLSATNCNVSLQFPQFAGGTQTVNVCQNKEYTGNIVSIAGSIFLVVFYIPIAWLLLRMIYNEIRSYTNG